MGMGGGVGGNTILGFEGLVAQQLHVCRIYTVDTEIGFFFLPLKNYRRHEHL